MNPETDAREAEVNAQKTAETAENERTSAAGPAAEESGKGGEQRTAVRLSLIGLILSVAAGVGLPFSIAGILSALADRKRGREASVFAVLLGAAGVVLSLTFFALIAVSLVLAFQKY